MPRYDKSLTAAALPASELVSVSRGAVIQGYDWGQKDKDERVKAAWKAYESIGELHYIANGIIGAAVETLAWYGAVEDLATTYTAAPPVETKLSEGDAAIVRNLVQGIKPRWGEQQDFMRALAVNLFMVGEGSHLTQFKGGQWLHEFIPQSRVYEGQKAANGKVVQRYKDPITNEDLVVGDGRNLSRIWRPHPNNPGKADSAVFSILPLLEELGWIQMLMNSTLRKRIMTSGLLLMPNNILGPDYNPADQTAIAGAVNKVEAEIIRQLSANIAEDEDSPAMPLILFAPAETIKDGFRYIPFGEELSDIAIQERREIIRRIANSLDVPSEFVMGIGEVNHWSAWLVRDLLWQQHIQPMATLIANSITSQFLRPALRADKNFTGDPDQVKLWFKAHSLQTHPDLFQFLVQAHDLGIIGKEPILQALGIPPEAAISDEEFELWLRLKLGEQSAPQEGEVGPDGTVVEPAPSRQRTGDRRQPPTGPANPSRRGEDGPSQR